MADAMEAFWQDMQQEAPNEFRRWQRHGLVACGAGAAVIFVAEGDSGRVHGNQPAVRVNGGGKICLHRCEERELPRDLPPLTARG